MIKNIFNSTHFPIFCSLLLQAAGLLLFAATDLKAILPAGNSELVDTIYLFSGTIRISFYLITVLIAGLLLLRKSPLPVKLLLALGFLVAGLTSIPWFTILLAPLLVTQPDSSREPDSGSTENPLQILLTTLVLGSFFLMTLQSSFPHDELRSVLYLQGFSTIIMIILVLTLVLLAVLSGWAERLLGKFPFFHLNGSSFVIALFFYFVLRIYGNQKLSSFVTQFDLGYTPSMVAGFMTAILLLFITPLTAETKGIKRLSLFYRPLVSRPFWVKFFLISLGFRHLILALGKAEQDILIIILYDYINVFAPVLIVILSLGLSHMVLKRFQSRFYPVAISLVILLPMIYAIGNAGESWTILSDIRNPYSKFITSGSRKILKETGLLRKERIIDQRVEYLEQRIRTLKNSETLSPDEVFFLEKAPDPGSTDSPELSFQHIFLFVADAIYAGHTSLHNYNRDTTPFLYRFRREAVQFTQFQASSSATGLSITSLFSGLYKGNYEPLSENDPDLLCDSLLQSGYTSFVARWSGCREEGNTDKAQLFFLNQAGKKKKDREVIWQYIREHPQQPVFAYVHVKGGHGPWKLDNGEKVFGQGKIDIYDALVLQADQEFSEFVDIIKSLNIYDRSIIIFTSDHGIGLGYKNNDFTIYSNMYNVNMHVPFLIRIPGFPPQTVRTHYSLVDIRPTLEEMIGFTSTQTRHGTSFLKPISGRQSGIDRCVFAIATYSDRYAMKCADGVRVVYNRDWSYLNIYDTRQDPYEQNGLIEKTSEDAYRKLIEPFARFMAFGSDSYSRSN